MNLRRDRRLFALVLTSVAVLAGGAWLAALEPTHPALTVESPEGHPDAARKEDLRVRFDAAVVLLQARKYEPAAAALRRLLEVSPQMPEAHANMGFAMLGLQQPAAAREHFERAAALKASQANAYYGLALAHEGLGDIELALGAMRTYLHLASAEDEAHLRKARAAVWEWESQLALRRAAPGR